MPLKARPLARPDEINLARPTAPAAKPLSPAELKERLPLAAGAVRVVKASPKEAERLAEMGWTGQQLVPANLGEISDVLKRELAREAAALNNDQAAIAELHKRAEGVAPLSPPEGIDVRDLPPAQQAIYQSLLTDIINAPPPEEPEVSALDPSVRQALQEPELLVTDDNMPLPSQPQPARSTVQTQPPQAPVTSPSPAAAPEPEPTGKGPCARCGFPRELDRDELEITDDQKREFFEATQLGTPYVQQFQLFGGQVSVMFRSLSLDETDAIYAQVRQDMQLGVVNGWADENEFIARYRLALQLVQLDRAVSPITFPDDLAHWPASPDDEQVGKLSNIWAKVNRLVCKNESMHRILATLVARFNVTCLKMEKLVLDPDFYSAIGT